MTLLLKPSIPMFDEILEARQRLSDGAAESIARYPQKPPNSLPKPPHIWLTSKAGIPLYCARCAKPYIRASQPCDDLP